MNLSSEPSPNIHVSHQIRPGSSLLPPWKPRRQSPQKTQAASSQDGAPLGAAPLNSLVAAGFQDEQQAFTRAYRQVRGCWLAQV